MDGAAISEELTGATLDYGIDTQVFYSHGRTLYSDPRQPWVRWAARGDQYCPVWPPSKTWVCYDMYRSGEDGFRFVGQSGNPTDGTRVAKE